MQRYLLVRNDEVGEMLKAIMCLPLLPSHIMLEELHTFQLHFVTSPTITRLLNFYEERLRNIGVQNISIYNQTDSISDVVEQYSSRLETKIGTRPTSAWKFTSK